MSSFQNDAVPKNLQSISVSAFYRMVLKFSMISKVCACAEMTFLGKVTDSILIIFIYLSTDSNKTGDIKQFLELRRSLSPWHPNSILLTFVIIWSFLLGISRHFLMPTKIYLFLKFSLFHLKYKVYLKRDLA